MSNDWATRPDFEPFIISCRDEGSRLLPFLQSWMLRSRFSDFTLGMPWLFFTAGTFTDVNNAQGSERTFIFLYFLYFDFGWKKFLYLPLRNLYSFKNPSIFEKFLFFPKYFLLFGFWAISQNYKKVKIFFWGLRPICWQLLLSLLTDWLLYYFWLQINCLASQLINQVSIFK